VRRARGRVVSSKVRDRADVTRTERARDGTGDDGTRTDGEENDRSDDQERGRDDDDDDDDEDARAHVSLPLGRLLFVFFSSRFWWFFDGS